MNSFTVDYLPIVPESLELGSAAVLPWDSETFGFAVGTFVPSDSGKLPQQSGALREGIEHWMSENAVELASCTVPADSFEWNAYLASCGFVFVDMQLTAFARKLTQLPEPRLSIRPALPEDMSQLEAIAGSAFRFGRYHADVRFPKELADERYRRWISNAALAQSEREFVFVSGAPGSPTGFIHAILQGTVIDLRLAAVDAAQNSGILGPSLFAAALVALRERGARSAKAKVSAGNTGVLSLYSSLGFHFTGAENIFHRHAPTAKHLLPMP